MAWHAICETKKHGDKLGMWRGPGRKTQDPAEEDARAHNEAYSGHVAAALEDTADSASAGDVQQGTGEPQGTEEQQSNEES